MEESGEGSGDITHRDTDREKSRGWMDSLSETEDRTEVVSLTLTVRTLLCFEVHSNIRPARQVNCYSAHYAPPSFHQFKSGREGEGKVNES